MKRPFFLPAFAVMLFLSACGPADSGTLGTAPTGTPPASTQPSASPAPAKSPDAQLSSTLTIQVWFARNGKLVPAARTRPKTVATSHLALTELIAGPSTLETTAGVRSSISSDLTFEIKGLTGGVATVNFPAGFYADGREAARLRQAQVIYTLTQFPSVSRVGFQSAGEATGWPLGRNDYADLLPRIVATNPVMGQRVSSPITVVGTAQVFEATVSVRILDAAGKEIATKFTNATCGYDCRGTYSTTISYQACGEQLGTVEVYGVSQVDGSRVDTFAIPVILSSCP